MPKKNSYSIFVDENFRKMGISRMEAFGELGEKWSKMSAKERAPYETKAGRTKQQIMTNALNRQNQTNVGYSYEDMERDEEERKKFKIKMVDWVNSKAIKGTRLHEPEEFYVICMQKHTKTHAGIVVPAEIAVIGFDLVNGVNDVFSKIIKNKQTWVKNSAPAYQFKMVDRAKHSHAIPVTENFPMSDNIENIVSELVHFIRKSTKCDGSSLPPIFTMDVRTETVDHIIEDNMEDINIALNYMFEEAASTVKPPIVYDILELFQAMYKVLMGERKVGDVKTMMVRDFLKKKLENDNVQLNQTGGDCCLFHHEMSKEIDFSTENCAAATAKRWIYLMCDFMTQGVLHDPTFCPAFGKHKPPRKDELGIFMHSTSSKLDIQKSIEMSVRKEYQNPISGAKTTAFGTMNGTTLLPTDRDPAVEVAKQLKEKMADLKISDSTEYYSFNDSAERLSKENFPTLDQKDPNCSKSRGDIRSSKSSETKSLSGNGKTRSARSRIAARFESSETENTTYQSYD